LLAWQVVAAFHGALRCLADANSTLLDDIANRCNSSLATHFSQPLLFHVSLHSILCNDAPLTSHAGKYSSSLLLPPLPPPSYLNSTISALPSWR
jgi:hypothetical protein